VTFAEASSRRPIVDKLPTSRREIIKYQYYEIKRLESKYRQLYEGSPQMYRTINLDGIIIDCNQSYVKNLGYSTKDQVIGHSIFEHVAIESIDAMRESFEEWRRNGIVRNKEVWLKRMDGSSFPVLINANNLYGDDGTLVGSNTVIIDITEISKTREQLEKSNKELKLEEQLKDEFIAIASHELRTPIQPLLGFAILAKRGLVSQEAAWDGVLKEARRLQKLANDILDVSRIESGNLSYEMQKVSVNDIITEIINYARYGVHDNHDAGSVAIETRLGDDIELYLDKARMIQALTNILNNSLKFTVEGRILIETCVLADKKLFEIKISDTGAGISTEMLPKLFGKFVTNGSGEHADKHGTGLGLFITRSIIQAHDGDIFAVNNEVGKGVTFTIRLPIRIGRDEKISSVPQ
jgi:PAS domain S-box-containing protein